MHGNWTAECSEAVKILKSQLTTSLILAHFDPNSLTIVTCYASTQALGAVLSQEQDGVERPVAFASRALTPTEQRYSVGERETLACVWATERWHLYLYGRRFTLLSPSSNDAELEFIQMLPAPWQSAVSLEKLQRESEHDSILSIICTYICLG